MLLATLLGAAVPDAPAAVGVAPENLDPKVSPATDFYRFANGGWLARNPVPPDRSYYGVDTEVQQRDEVRLQAILESPQVADAPAGSERRKLGDFYAACTDLDGIEAGGVAALRPIFTQIAALSAPQGLAALAAAGARLRSPDDGIAPLFAFYSEQDPRDARRVIGSLSQGGTALSSRDYYLAADPASRAVRSAYLRLLRATFGLLGDVAASATREAAAVLEIETQLARASLTPDALRDPVANTHPMGPAGLAALAPHFAWGAYFASLGLSPARVARVDVGQPETLAALDRLIVREPLSAWKSYLRWHVVYGRGSALPQGFARAQLAFYRVL